jgi:hypothetical protein
MEDKIVIINFKVLKSKRKALKKLLIDEDKTLTDFLNECVDNKLKIKK